MKPSQIAVLFALLASCSAVADIMLKNAGGNVGPVTSLNCMADAGLLCTRDAGSVGTIKCNGATATEAGCVTPQAQTYAGDKTFNGTVKTPILDAGVAAVGSLDMRASSIGNTKSSSTLLIASNTADGTTTSTVGSLTLQCTAAITATDLCLDVQASSGTHLLGMEANGTAVFSGHATAAGASVGAQGTNFSSTLGSGAAGDGTHFGGTGGLYGFTAGQGGNAGSGGLTAGQGGSFIVAGGNGGNDNGAVLGGGGGYVSVSAGFAGGGNAGGGATLAAGAGGAGSASHVSGVGGAMSLTAGPGGVGSGVIGGVGGAASLVAGAGGSDVASGAGAGGVLTLQSGAGGSFIAGAGAASGNVILDTGAATGAATPGTIAIGATNGGNITLGRSGKTVSVPAIASFSGTSIFLGAVAVGTNGTSFTSSKAVGSNIDFANVVKQTCVDTTATGLTDCIGGDPVSCSFPSALATGLAPSCFMSGVATVTYRLCNVTTADIDPVLGGFGARCFH